MCTSAFCCSNQIRKQLNAYYVIQACFLCTFPSNVKVRITEKLSFCVFFVSFCKNNPEFSIKIVSFYEKNVNTIFKVMKS